MQQYRQHQMNNSLKFNTELDFFIYRGQFIEYSHGWQRSKYFRGRILYWLIQKDNTFTQSSRRAAAISRSMPAQTRKKQGDSFVVLLDIMIDE